MEHLRTKIFFFLLSLFSLFRVFVPYFLYKVCHRVTNTVRRIAGSLHKGQKLKWNHLRLLVICSLVAILRLLYRLLLQTPFRVAWFYHNGKIFSTLKHVF